jgi:hypothetical protein
LYGTNSEIWYIGTRQLFATTNIREMVETSHFMSLDIAPEPHIPKDFWKAMAIPEWNKAIDTELTKFETNNCFQFVTDTGQHLVPMMWLSTSRQTEPRKPVSSGDDPTRGL